MNVEIRKLVTEQSECYITGCLIDYHYIKRLILVESSYYRSTVVDLTRQK